MNKITKIATGLAVLPMLAFSVPVYADSPGDLAGGDDIYLVRNLKDNAYTKTATVACGESVKYSVKLSNTDYSTLTDVTVKASLTSGKMTASATKADNSTTTTSDEVTVTIPANSELQYVSGSTGLYELNGDKIRDLADGVTAGGVNAGDLNGSTREFLQFQAKLHCAPTETPKDIKVCEISTKKIVVIKENEFNSAKHTRDLSKCDATVTPPTTTTPSKPAELVKTGAGQVAAIFAVAAAFGAVAYNVVLRRQNAN